LSREPSVLNGVRPDGTYAYAHVDDHELAERLLRLGPDWVPPEPPKESRFRRPRYGVDVHDLASAGWAVVFPPGRSRRKRELLEPLLSRRREEAGGLFREIQYIPNETCNYFLTRHGTSFGDPDPERMPYYVLLVGNAEEIPFRFQWELDQLYAVGRIDFEEEEQYRAYAESVRDAEERPSRMPRRVTFFGAQNEGDRATQRTTENLVLPTARKIEERCRGWEVERILGHEATREELSRLLSGPEPPPLLFTASHGMVFRPDDPRQKSQQGALVCSDWPGVGNPVAREHYLAAEDLRPAGRPLQGTITFNFACHSGGTPEWDSFPDPGAERPDRLAHSPFAAALPRRLLGESGALAVIAHVDRAWTTSFDWEGEGEGDPRTFVNVLLPLLDGCRVGFATEALGSLYGSLSRSVKEGWEARRPAPSAGDLTDVARLWRATNDIRSFLVFGDPAVYLPAAHQ
jgi:hypothetical protein